MKRLVACVLCVALVAAAPGAASYAAAADVVNSSAGLVRPLPIGTSQLNVLKGTGPLPVAPGALGIDPTERVLPQTLVAPALAPQVPAVAPEESPAELSPTAPAAAAVAPADPAAKAEAEGPASFHGAVSQAAAELTQLANLRRAAKGLKPLAVPEIVAVPLELPGAFAARSGLSRSTLGVTQGLKESLLDSETARAGLIGLVQSAADDAQGKPYKVFRRAIAGSVSAVAADATPNELSQALLRAGDADIRTLGRRMLKGVLGQAFARSHARGLRESLVGKVTAAVAYASSAVAAGESLVASGVGRLRGRSEAPVAQEPDARAKELSLDPAKAQREPSETVETLAEGAPAPHSVAVPGGFAALAARTIARLTRGSGAFEARLKADRAGAQLTDDPEGLALGLGLLAGWKPKQETPRVGSFAPRVAALGGSMTVDPIAQLQGAESLAAETRGRIIALHDLAEELHRAGAQDFRPRPPPTTAAPTMPSSGPAKAGLLRRAWGAIKGFVRVLPDKARNRELWRFIWGKALESLGFDFHYTALPKMVDPNNDQPSRVLYNRAGNSAAWLSSNLVTGSLADRYSVQKLLAWTFLGRSLVLLAVPILFHFCLLSFLAFQLIIFAVGFMASTTSTASSVAFNRILADDTAYYNKANAVYNFVISVVGVVGPLLAGSFIVLMDSKFGLLSGNALSYGVFSVALLAGFLIFRKLKIPKDELLQARRDLWDKIDPDPRRGFWKALFGVLRRSKAAGPVLKGVSAARVNGRPVLIVEVKGAPALVRGLPSEFAGFPVKIAAAQSVWKDLAAGARIIWGDRFLKIYLLFSTVTALIADPIVFSAIPRYIDGYLHVAKAAQGGVFGLYLAAAGLGTGLASLAMMLLRDQSETKIEAALLGSKKGLMGLGLDDARAAKEAVLARYRVRWKTEPAWEPIETVFQQDLLAESAARINAKVFNGGKNVGELARLLNDSSLGPRLWDWGAASFDKVMKAARRQARSGLTPLERQGRWSSWLNGLGWLLYWGVFFLPSMHLSLAAIVLASMLQAPAMAIWSTIVQHVLGTRHPESMGKIYAFISFYGLVFGILGPIGYTWLVGHMSLIGGLALTAAALTVVAICDFIQPFKSFPLDKGTKP